MSLITQQNATSFPAGVLNMPPNWPTKPAVGKISLLFNYNSTNLYHRFSPYTDRDNLFNFIPNKQPFIYRFPDEGDKTFDKQIPAAVDTFLSAGAINQSTIDDVVRVSKFTISPAGVLYNIKQFGLQRLQPFDETRNYNPLSPILATVQGMTFGIGERPKRHIEGGYLLGLLNSVTSTVGISLDSGYQKPDSTAGDTTALPVMNSSQGKGMIRGTDANKALARFKSTLLPPDPASNVSLTSGFKKAFSAAFTNFVSSITSQASLFFGSATKSPGQYRADEDGYTLMVNSGLFSQAQTPWIAKINTYGDYVKIQNEYGATNSYMTTDLGEGIWDDYSTNNPKDYITTFADPAAQKVVLLNNVLQSVIDKINNNGVSNYIAAQNPASYLLPAGNNSNATYVEYDNWTNKKINNKVGVKNEYFNNANGIRTLDKTVSQNNIRMGASFVSDGLNQIGVINNNKQFDSTTKTNLSINYSDWTEYNPYNDDLIAFYFYDVVNKKYIPFRATVKGISEGSTAFWDELRFIGRSDQLYSYNGFSRTLSFGFNVVIGSISELLPTWQKINYMASCVKPSNYTIGGNTSDNNYSRFAVPPMFMITIGDLYKYQPVVITSVNVNVPDDAAWETLNSNNSNDWTYLNGLIKGKNTANRYAQLPKEVEIVITCNLLEKERAILGGSHFGHAPRIDDWESVSDVNARYLTGDDTLPPITEFNKSLIVWNDIEDV